LPEALLGEEDFLLEENDEEFEDFFLDSEEKLEEKFEENAVELTENSSKKFAEEQVQRDHKMKVARNTRFLMSFSFSLLIIYFLIGLCFKTKEIVI